MSKSYGFRPGEYDQIIVFDSEQDFTAIVVANPGMTAIMGADDHTKKEFPGVYIAGLKESLQVGDYHAGKPESSAQGCTHDATTNG